jgi:hypothetical protein
MWGAMLLGTSLGLACAAEIVVPAAHPVVPPTPPVPEPPPTPPEPAATTRAPTATPPAGATTAWVVDSFGVGYDLTRWIREGRPDLDAGARCFEWSSDGGQQVDCK